MSDKLDQITEQLYSKGIEKAKEDSEKLLADAENKAKKIIEDAEKTSSKIIADAKNKSELYEKDVLEQLQIAANQMKESVKNAISDSVISYGFGEIVKESINSKQFIETVLVDVVGKYIIAKENGDTYEIGLSSQFEEDFKKHIGLVIDKMSNNNITVIIDPKNKEGFTITNSDKKYKMQFSEETLMNLIVNTLGKRMYELLFEK